MNLRRLVLVFARTPRDEAAIKPLGGRAQAERLHRALLDRALAAAAGAGAHTLLVTPAERCSVPPGVESVRQRGDSFGERLEHAVADAFADGWRQVVVIGGDAPRLDAARIREAFARLSGSGDASDDALEASARAVIGPARDGGYYLLGLTRHDPSLFAAIPFCTRATFAATVAALAAARFATVTLPPLDDVDTLDDVRRLAAAAAASDPLARLAHLARDLLASAGAAVAPRLAPPRSSSAAVFVDARGPPPPFAALV